MPTAIRNLKSRNIQVQERLLSMFDHKSQMRHSQDQVSGGVNFHSVASVLGNLIGNKFKVSNKIHFGNKVTS